MKKSLLLGTTIAAVAFAAPVYAQNAQQQAQVQSGALEEIVVTAERRAASLQTVPVAISAFTVESLKNRQITQPSDLERYVPSLKMRNNITSPTNLSPSLRGSLQQDASLVVAESPFGLYVDDVYLGRLNGNNITLADIERVEVLRGPQGTLYGRNTLAGAIKYITRTPSEDNEWVNAEAGFGSFNSYKVSVSAGSAVGSHVGASLSLQKNGKGGIWTNRVNGENVGDENNLAGRGKLHFTPTDAVDVVASVSYTNSKNDALQLIPAITPRVPSNLQYHSRDVVPLYGPYTVSRPVVTLSPAPIENKPRGQTKQWISSLNMTYDFGDASLQSITAFVNTDDFFSTDFGGTGGVPFIAGAAQGGNISGTFGATVANADQFSQEVKIQGTAVDDKLNYMAGAYYLNETADQAFGWNIGLFGGPASNSTMAVSTESVAFFTQNDYALTDQLKATAGLRWVQDDKHFDISFISRSPIFAAQAPARHHNKYQKWMPKFGLDYSVPTSGGIDSLLLFASVGRGFKSGGYNGIAITNLNDARSAYGPESNWTYEAGFKSDMLDNRLRVNANYFYNRISDLTLNAQVLNLVTGIPDFPVQNAGNATIKGLELEATAVPVDGLTLYLNSAFLSGKFRSLKPGSAPLRATALFGVAKGKPPQLPDFAYTIGFDYRLPLNAGNADTELLFGADWFHSDDFLTSATNEFVQDAYHRVSAFVGVAIDKKWDMRLSVKNLTDERSFSTGSRGFLGGYLYQPPLEYMLTIKYTM